MELNTIKEENTNMKTIKEEKYKNKNYEKLLLSTDYRLSINIRFVFSIKQIVSSKIISFAYMSKSQKGVYYKVICSPYPKHLSQECFRDDQKDLAMMCHTWGSIKSSDVWGPTIVGSSAQENFEIIFSRTAKKVSPRLKFWKILWNNRMKSTSILCKQILSWKRGEASVIIPIIRRMLLSPEIL